MIYFPCHALSLLLYNVTAIVWSAFQKCIINFDSKLGAFRFICKTKYVVVDSYFTYFQTLLNLCFHSDEVFWFLAPCTF
jgi:hypothetical protein